ncbi:MAG: HupE/UreJ family protein [Myxococcota bacterium]
MALRTLAVLIVAFTADPASAHPLRFGRVDLHAEGERVVVTFVHSTTEASRALEPSLEPACEVAPVQASLRGTIGRRTAHLRCPGGLIGRTLDATTLVEAGSQLVVTTSGDHETRTLLDAASPTVRFARPPPALPRYLHLGFVHIFEGADHLAFLLLLFLIVRRRDRWRRALVVAVTSFTLGHSLSLALVSTGWLAVPSRPVEAAIALSIVFLAVELCGFVRDPTRAPWTRRRTVVTTAGFGLLHGLGFAGALGEIGFAPNDVWRSLLGFNLGVEAGQLLFLSGVAAATLAARRWKPSLPLPLAAAYLVGSVASWWWMERVLELGTR